MPAPALPNRTIVRQDSAYLLIDIPNELHITGYDNARWDLRSSGGERIEQTDSPWIFRLEPTTTGPDTIQLFRNGRSVLTKTFYTISPEDPKLRLGAITANSATTGEVIANRILATYYRTRFYHRPIHRRQEIPEDREGSFDR